ncbi:MAG TPA: S8 family serine peptidase [Candidatus Binatia bacterium]|nr:S8 family serine peptidase [Candidatus Binatia bacterium]
MELRELSASAPLSRVRLEKQTLTEATRKIGSALRAVADAKRPAAGPLVALPPSLSSDGRVRVYLRLKHVGAAELESLRQLGARIETSREALNVVQAAIEPKDVKRLAALSFVEALNPADVPVFRVGAATTEGDQAARADLARMLGFDGSGVTVGVISDGIDSLTVSQASGDLGEVTVPNDVRCRAGTGDEGTAILEIVHDIAPGAKLLFSGPGTSVEMIEAVECLTAAGADVIVDDVGFLGEPFFQDGPVATAVRAAVQAGVSYHSAAGNDGQDYLEQDYRASPSTSFHDFFGGPVDNTDGILIDGFGLLRCVLQWADPFGHAADDYDLYVLDEFLTPVASSTDVQTGTQDPREFVAVVNASPFPAVAFIVIDKFSGEARRMKLLCIGGSIWEYSSAGGIFGHPAVPEVVTVGAIDVSDPGEDDVEDFSSRGPVTITVPAIESRAKPDIAAFDGVSISNAGGFPQCPPFCRFFGTSAAAPHSAAVAALMRSKNPRLTARSVHTILRSTAVDIGPGGTDFAAGAGRLDALAAVNAVPLAQCLEDAACDDGNVCTVDACADDGVCRHDALVCPDDGNVCDGVATCDPGVGCVRSFPLVCDDGDDCTVDACDRVLGCGHLPLPAGTGLACRLGRLTSSDACRAAGNPWIEKLIDKRVPQIQKRLRAADHASKRRGRALVKQARRMVLKLRADVKRGSKRHGLDEPCVSEVVAALTEQAASIRELRF